MHTFEETKNFMDQKFQPKDLVELYQDSNELEMRGHALYGLICREATPEEYENYHLRTNHRKNWTFYRVVVEDEIHFVATQFMSLVQRNPDEVK